MAEEKVMINIVAEDLEGGEMIPEPSQEKSTMGQDRQEKIIVALMTDSALTLSVYLTFGELNLYR